MIKEHRRQDATGVQPGRGHARPVLPEWPHDDRRSVLRGLRAPARPAPPARGPRPAGRRRGRDRRRRGLEPRAARRPLAHGCDRRPRARLGLVHALQHRVRRPPAPVRRRSPRSPSASRNPTGQPAERPPARRRLRRSERPERRRREMASVPHHPEEAPPHALAPSRDRCRRNAGSAARSADRSAGITNGGFGRIGWERALDPPAGRLGRDRAPPEDRQHRRGADRRRRGAARDRRGDAASRIPRPSCRLVLHTLVRAGSRRRPGRSSRPPL